METSRVAWQTPLFLKLPWKLGRVGFMLFALLACSTDLPSVAAQTQSSVYGYAIGSGAASFKSIDDVEAAVRANYNQPSAAAAAGYPLRDYAPPLFKWTVLFHPLGSINIQSVTPPEEWSAPYYKLTPPIGGVWPPAPVDPGCASINALCTPFGWCPDIATEVSRITCEINATYPPNGLCLQSDVEVAGTYPSPWAPTNYSYNSLPDPTGAQRWGHSFEYVTTDLSQTRYALATVAPCGVAAEANRSRGTEPSPPPPPGDPPYPWGLGEKRYYWCAASTTSGPEAGLPNVCVYYPFKRAISPPVFKQTPPANCPSEGNPCGPGNGNKSVVETDFSAGPITFQRFYNSLRELKPYSFIDRNWSHSFSQRVQTSYDTSGHASPYFGWAAIQNERGLADLFRGQAGTTPGAYRSATQRDLILYFISDTAPMPWVEVFPDGRVHKFDVYGRLMRIEYPDDVRRSLSLTYLIQTPDPVTPHYDYHDYHFYAVDTVVDATGRGIQFDYRPATDPPSLSDFFVQVTGIHAYPSGEPLVSYVYDEEERLAAAVTDSGARQYAYGEAGHVGAPNQRFNLTSIIDENEAQYASYWYDDYGRVTRSEHAGGAGKVELEYRSDTAVSVTRPNGEVAYYTFDLSDVWRRPAFVEDGNGRVKSTILNNDAACPTSLGNPSDERLCQETDSRGVVTQYQYGATGNASLFTRAIIEGAGTAAQRRTEIDRYDRSFNYRIKERRVFQARTGALASVTRWAYNTRHQTVARCQIDPADAIAMAYTCSASTEPTPTAKVRRWVTTYCEEADVAAGTCPLVGLVKSVNGPRLASDAGMDGHDDLTTYTYRLADDTTCITNGVCSYRRGDLWKVTNALGHVTEYVSYDTNGRLTRLKDVNGTLTDYVHHARGWLIDRIVRSDASGSPSPDDAITHIDYDAVGNVTRVTQPDGVYLAYAYDSAHRLVRISDNEGNTTDYCPGGVGSADCLDAAGNRRVEQIKDPSGTIKRRLARVYNQLSQLTEVLNAAGSPVESSAGLNETGVVDGYDGNGNRVLSEDGLGIATRQEYDPLNRLKATIQNYSGTDPATADTTTGYTYDTRDNLRRVTDPDGLNTAYDYDGLNNLTALHSPDTGDTNYQYDKAGNRVSQSDNRGVTSSYTYDALNRLTGIGYPTAALNVDYIYDQPDTSTGCTGSYPKGRLTSMSDASGSTTYCYDRRGNRTTKSQLTGSVSLVTQFTYTRADRLATLTYPSGAVVAYTRDTVGRVQTLSWKASAGAPAISLIDAASYYPFGPLNTLIFGNGRTLTKAYDQDYAIDAVTGTPADALTLDIEVDVMGNLIHASDTRNPPIPDRAYEYDPLYRLTTAQTASIPPAPLESYTYNPTGDRMSAALNGAPAQPYAYTPATHHLASVAGVPRTHDANGNQTSLASTPYPLVYDDRNRLVESRFDGFGSVQVYQYLYNGSGERVAKQTPDRLATSTYDSSGHLLSVRTQATGGGTGLIGPSFPTWDEVIYLDDLPVGIARDGVLSYVETDHLGTPRQVVDPATNTVLWKWDLLASVFGTNVPNEDPDGDGTTFTMNLRFPGQYFDAETGLHNNVMRDYEPTIGRYVESDPIGLEGGINTYAYVESGPFSEIDPDGLAGCSGGCHSPSPTAPWPTVGPIPIPAPTPNYPPGLSVPVPGLGLGIYIVQLCTDIAKGCPPCDPYPVGTIGYQGPEIGVKGRDAGVPHYNLYQVEQIPSTCKCIWKEKTKKLVGSHHYYDQPNPSMAINLNGSGRPPNYPR